MFRSIQCFDHDLHPRKHIDAEAEAKITTVFCCIMGTKSEEREELVVNSLRNNEYAHHISKFYKAYKKAVGNEQKRIKNLR